MEHPDGLPVTAPSDCDPKVAMPGEDLRGFALCLEGALCEFNGNCRHTVLPMESGDRISLLAYLRREAYADDVEPETTQALTDLGFPCKSRHFLGF